MREREIEGGGERERQKERERERERERESQYLVQIVSKARFQMHRVWCALTINRQVISPLIFMHA